MHLHRLMMTIAACMKMKAMQKSQETVILLCLSLNFSWFI